MLLLKPKKAPQSKAVPSTETKYDKPAHQKMATAALCLSAPAKQFQGSEGMSKLMMEGAVDLYHEMQPRDAIDAALGMVMTALTSGTLDCFAQATNLDPQHVKLRDINLRYGIRGAEILVKLAQAYDGRRGKIAKKVAVGKVNVEAGGQAIVGTVEAGATLKKPTAEG
jgi:hypothetical protein